jgi:DNA-directed RNA polymerase beta' subunit
VLSVLPVPPVAIRPSVEMDGASNEDDLTMKLMVRTSSCLHHTQHAAW